MKKFISYERIKSFKLRKNSISLNPVKCNRKNSDFSFSRFFCCGKKQKLVRDKVIGDDDSNHSDKSDEIDGDIVREGEDYVFESCGKKENNNKNTGDENESSDGDADKESSNKNDDDDDNSDIDESEVDRENNSISDYFEEDSDYWVGNNNERYYNKLSNIEINERLMMFNSEKIKRHYNLNYPLNPPSSSGSFLDRVFGRNNSNRSHNNGDNSNDNNQEWSGDTFFGFFRNIFGGRGEGDENPRIHSNAHDIMSFIYFFY
jgi:hypothetical protein